MEYSGKVLDNSCIKKDDKKNNKNNNKKTSLSEGENTDSGNEQQYKLSTNKQLLIVGIASLLFVLLSNHLAYKGTNMLGGFTLNQNDSPSDLGIVIHGVVFFGLFFAVVNYLQ
jgi:hypothetical protein